MSPRTACAIHSASARGSGKSGPALPSRPGWALDVAESLLGRGAAGAGGERECLRVSGAAQAQAKGEADLVAIRDGAAHPRPIAPVPVRSRPHSNVPMRTTGSASGSPPTLVTSPRSTIDGGRIDDQHE